MKLRSWIIQVGLLLACSGAGALAVNSLRPDGLANYCPVEAFRVLSPGEFQKSFQGGRVNVIDARPAEWYARGHVAGALNLPAGWVREAPGRFVAALPSRGLLILYCQSLACHDSRRLAEALIRAGVDRKRIRIFAAGWKALQTMPAVPKTGTDAHVH